MGGHGGIGAGKGDIDEVEAWTEPSMPESQTMDRSPLIV